MNIISSQSYHTLNHWQSNKKSKDMYPCGLGACVYDKYVSGLGISIKNSYVGGLGIYEQKDEGH